MHLYKDRYYPDITTEQEVFLRDHIGTYHSIYAFRTGT